MENPMNQRLPANPNLRIYTTPEYRGMPIQANTSQPCLEEYLNKAYRTLERTKKEYKRIFAARIDLRYPAEGARGRQNDNHVMERFKKALDARIQARSARRDSLGKTVHPCRVRMIWAREQSGSKTPHYHLVLLFNRDAYFRLGSYAPEADNLLTLIRQAWASALSLPEGESLGLVHVPENAEYNLSAREDYRGECDLFYRISYLCKARSKTFGNRHHCFGASTR